MTTYYDLTGFQRDLLEAITGVDDEPYGLALKHYLDERYADPINHSRLYQNLDQLAELDFITRDELDTRTNVYTLTDAGRQYLQRHTETLTGLCGRPLRQADRDVLGNVEGTWKLTLRELKPEFVGLLADAIAFLNTHSDEYAFQIGGARNFGAGIADVWLLNPLYADHELRRVFNRAQATTSAMAEKDTRWREECRPVFREALETRLAGRTGETITLPDNLTATNRGAAE